MVTLISVKLLLILVIMFNVILIKDVGMENVSASVKKLSVLKKLNVDMASAIQSIQPVSVMLIAKTGNTVLVLSVESLSMIAAMELSVEMAKNVSLVNVYQK